MSAWDRINCHVREENGLPDTWVGWKYEAVGNAVLVTGAECPHLISRGPRKGEPNYRRRSGPVGTFSISYVDYRRLANEAADAPAPRAAAERDGDAP